MKLTDAFVKVLKFYKVDHVFGLQGGAVVHFFDSLERNKMSVTYNHHEESSALAATAYAKMKKNIGCVIVTTGPGSTNAITGLLAAWQDSVPVIFISGQARSNHTSYGKKVRQVGTQEVNICDVVRPLTKYTKFINKKNIFLPEIYKAIQIAKSGRPGPVWLDIALELHWLDIKFFKPKVSKKKIIKTNNRFKNSLKLIKLSKKPIFIIGSGIKSGKSEELFSQIVNKFNIPFVTTWNSADVIETNNKNNLGIIGMSGQRGANKAIFNSDLIICIGSHLSIPHTTTLYSDYAKNIKKIIVNIDQNQLKNLNVKFNLKINDSAENYLNFLLKNLKKINIKWENKKNLKKMNWYFPKSLTRPNSNIVIRKVTEKLKKPSCIIVDGGGSALYSGFQASIINKGNKIVCSSAISSMGTGLAETIGVHASNRFIKFLCIIGDGSFLMNLQDLQTISQKKINVIILVVNNNGYLAIRHTQAEFLKKRYFGTHPKYNLTFPKLDSIAKTFKVKFLKINNKKNIDKILKKALNNKGPILLEIVTEENQQSLFKQGYKEIKKGVFAPQPLSEMFPFFNKPIENTNN